MSTDTDAPAINQALEIISRAEQRAALSPAEARFLRGTVAGVASETRGEEASLPSQRVTPWFERILVAYSEGIVYGMGTGLIAGLVAVPLTGSQLAMGVGMFGGMAIGIGVAAKRETRIRDHAG